MRLLGTGDSNTKLRKGYAKGFETIGLSLAPHKISGANVCAHASPGCIESCLFGSGMGSVFPKINASRIAKTKYFRSDRETFLKQLSAEIALEQVKVMRNDMEIACRLNVFSDIPWEKYSIIDNHPSVQFYDYTKNPKRFGLIRPNYWLTFSRSEVNHNHCLDVLNNGGNVAVVFADSNNPYVGKGSSRQELPLLWEGFSVLDGDTSDLRFQDDRGGTL